LSYSPAEALNSASRSSCETRKQELISVGGTEREANWLAYKVSWGEAGCVLQYVFDHDDSSISRYGLNAKAGNWKPICGHKLPKATKDALVDAHCAVNALRKIGPKAWSIKRYGRP